LLGLTVPLFDGYEDIFKRAMADCTVYGEYGCGASTMWVAKNTSCKIISVDTSEIWATHVRESLPCRTDLLIKYVDVGPVKKWGRPESYANAENFSGYTEYLWEQADVPDVVLVDGRFRVCCFLTTLARAREGTVVIFDDYIRRPHYHYVERFLKPVEVNGRQAKFILPPLEKRDTERILASVKKFRYVLD